MERNYHIILEKNNRPGDYARIDIHTLTKDLIFDDTLKIIDEFTEKYSYNDLLNLIIKSNTVTEDYLSDSTLKIIQGDTKYKLDIITNETKENFNLVEFIYNNISNKEIMNNLFNKINSLDESKSKKLKSILEEENVFEVVLLIQTMNYFNKRRLELYIIDKLLIKEVQREKKAA